MKFVIWGLGIRGKRIADIIGIRNIKAFLDFNTALADMEYCGVPIITIEEYVDLYMQYALIISPIENREIVKILEERNISVYFLLNECPSELYFGQLQFISEILLPGIEDNGHAVLFGNFLYSVLLWENFLQRGYRIPLVMHQDNDRMKEVLCPISKDVYFLKEYVFKENDSIIYTVNKFVEIDNGNIFDYYHLDNVIGRFLYPELRQFKNFHSHEKCFIIGNGSSLSIADLDALYEQEEICFGMNGIPLLFENTKWRPDYYVCEDGKALDLYGDMIIKSKIKNIFVSEVNKIFLERVKKLKGCQMFVFHMIASDYASNLPEFSENIEKHIMCGYTVTYACLQIAIYMGFRKIYLLGIDFDYENGATTEMKHFSKKYHLSETQINRCKKGENLLAYQAARKYADFHGIEIYNATRGGKLEVFERVDFDSLINRGVILCRVFSLQRIGVCV